MSCCVGAAELTKVVGRLHRYDLPPTLSQSPGVTSLKPWDVYKCFQLKLWDPQRNRMVGYP